MAQRKGIALPFLVVSPKSKVVSAKFKVGDMIHNEITREEGRIVRIADSSPSSVAYIVSIAPGNLWNTTREALWRESVVKQ
jgi:hypothetical protein